MWHVVLSTLVTAWVSEEGGGGVFPFTPPPWGVLLDPCAHCAYFWVLFITQIQNA